MLFYDEVSPTCNSGIRETITIVEVIAGNPWSATTFMKSDSGTLILTEDNTYTGH